MASEPDEYGEDHSHGIQDGEEYIDKFGEVWKIVSVLDDGDVLVMRSDMEPYMTEEPSRWNEKSVTKALSDGMMNRKSDGKSQELVIN